MSETRTLADAIVEQQARLRMLIGYGKEIGPAGAFYVAVCENLLKRIDRAAMEQDTVAMIGLLQEAQEIKE